jgi:1-deoxy-D-xylulose-5-phosphate reductoisomerase
MKKKIAVLGATGSIGKSTLDVLRQYPDDFEPVLLTSNSNSRGLLKLNHEFPKAVTVFSGAASSGGFTYSGEDGLLEAIAETEADITVNGIAGAAGLKPSLAAIENGSDLALANKETVIMAGPLVFGRAKENGVNIIPVDSEHSAIFNLLRNKKSEDIDELILTASGGPFRTLSLEEMAGVKASQALAHPTWNMGPKITIDSASLANKGLEVIEAVRLFKVLPEKVKVVIHPQSIVHAMLRMKDSAVYAQLSRPDMKLPILQALYYPETRASLFGALDFRDLRMEFGEPDTNKFPMLSLAYKALGLGGLCPCVYNGANEEAAGSFLAGGIGFLDIPRIVEYVLHIRPWNRDAKVIGDVFEADREARGLAREYIRKLRKT